MVIIREFVEEISINNDNPFPFPVQDDILLSKDTSGDLPTPTFGAKAADEVWQIEQIFGVVVISLLVPFILGSNLLVFVAVRKFKRLQVPTNYFLVSLAAADIIIALVIPFVLAAEIHKDDIDNIYVCLAPNRILMMACGVSILSLAAIAYDRYTALANPLEYVSIMTMKKIAAVITLSWVYSAVIAWIPLFGHWHQNIDSLSHPCSFRLLHSKAHTIFLSAIFAPACFAIFFCYFRIYIVARHHARAIAAVEISVQHNLQVRYIIKDTKYAKTLALVMGVFLFLWLPYLTCLFFEIISDLFVNDWVRNYLSFLALLNSGLNPWVYAFKNNEFRAAFKRIFKEYFPSCDCSRSAPRRPSILSESSTLPGSNSSLNLSRTITSSVASTDLIHTVGIISEVVMEGNISSFPTVTKLNKEFLPDLFKSYIPNVPAHGSKDHDDSVSSDESEGSVHSTDESHEECTIDRAP